MEIEEPTNWEIEAKEQRFWESQEDKTTIQGRAGMNAKKEN